MILVTHDLRESVFQAATVYVMNKRPGRMVVRREIKLPRPCDLELLHTPQFIDTVQALRGHLGAVCNTLAAASPTAAAGARLIGSSRLA